MKKLFKILAVIIIVLILAVVILPFVFKGKIIEQAKQEINNNLNAKVDFDDFSLSLFSTFPNFMLKISDLSVVGVEEFENDTLAHIESFSVTIDFMTVLKGESYEIKSIHISNPSVQLLAHESGEVNWYIAKDTGGEESIEVEETEEGSVEDTSALSVIKVPANIDFFLSCAFDELIYDNMEMLDVAGAVKIKDEYTVKKEKNGDEIRHRITTANISTIIITARILNSFFIFY